MKSGEKRPYLVNCFIRGDTLTGKMKEAVVAYLAKLEIENDNFHWMVDTVTEMQPKK